MKLLIALIPSLVLLLSSTIPAFTISQEDFDAINRNAIFYDPDALALQCGGAPGSQLSSNIPDVWFNLINSVASDYPEVDPRVVASVLWAENRGWPEYKTSGWAISSAGAKGPWQFIPQSWFGWDTGITGWGADGTNYTDNSLYSARGMGRDGNGDGIKNPDDPVDAVHAAFVHLGGSAAKPIMEGYSGNAESAYSTIPFERNGQNLLSYTASYNGSGAPNNTTLSNFPNNENSNYVKINFWLLTSNFETGWLPESDQFVDAATRGTLFGGSADGSVSQGYCNTPGSGIVNSDGYSFPIAGSQDEIYSGYSWPCPGICHHDRTPAFDLSHTDDDSSVGIGVFAIHDGTIANLKTYKGIAGCYSFQLVGDDGWHYWYGHVGAVFVENGERVTAGQQITTIGLRKCTGNGSYPHLHIDRGFPQGRNGGSDCCRDPDITPLMNTLYDQLS